MKEKLKILTIGDVHGCKNWLKFADCKILSEVPNLETDFDYYVFVGDYTDSFELTNVEILDTLKKIVQFKLNYPDKVILLLGNHDLSYWYSIKYMQEYNCSGNRPEAFYDLNDMFRNNGDIFQVAFQIDNYIWTHAGIHAGWYNVEFPYTSTKIADDLNGSFRFAEKSLFDCSRKRGGPHRQGGPFWADKIETWTKPLKGYHQIVGHTPVPDIITHFPYNKHKDTSVTYVDCMAKDKFYVLEI